MPGPLKYQKTHLIVMIYLAEGSISDQAYRDLSYFESSEIDLFSFFSELRLEVEGRDYLRRLVRSPKSSSLGCMNCQTTGTVKTTTSPMVAQIATV